MAGGALSNAAISGAGGWAAKVLLVDDDPELVASTAMLLRARFPGSSVLTAASPSAAWRLLGSETPDLVVADYHMPDGGGVRFLEEVRRRFPKVRLILLSGDPDAFVVSKARPTGYTILTKPVDPQLFVRVVEKQFPSADADPGGV